MRSHISCASQPVLLRVKRRKARVITFGGSKRVEDIGPMRNEFSNHVESTSSMKSDVDFTWFCTKVDGILTVHVEPMYDRPQKS